MSILIRNANLVLAEKIKKGDLLITGGRIKEIGHGIQVEEGCDIIEAEGKYVLPGFIDIHNHGAAGFDFSFGKYDLAHDTFDQGESAFRSGLENALQFYYQHGVTKVLLTTMAAPLDILEQAFKQLKEYLENKYPYYQIIGGINLEGTFLKDPVYAGAQNPKFFYEVDVGIIEQLQDASGGLLKIVNVPPEHGEPGLKLIEKLSHDRIIVAGGHTAAYGDEFNAAVDHGLSLSVHFFNGPSRSSSKSFRMGGAEQIMLKSDKVSLELICDGYHVDPAYVRDAIARKEADRIIMITDSMFANGLPHLEKFSLFGLQGAVSSNKKYLQMVNAEDTLFGSVLSSQQGFSNLLNWFTREITGVWHRNHPALSLDQSIILASRLASGNPARLLGIFENNEEPGTGSLAPGKAADLILADIRQDTDVSFEIKKVVVKGQVV
ncbi:MAG: amidohydrolase family protein [Saprospiraceae bacterium]|nr:amidohydrolase family protein [Saprospiraceae bacterium]